MYTRRVCETVLMSFNQQFSEAYIHMAVIRALTKTATFFVRYNDQGELFPLRAAAFVVHRATTQ